MFADREDLVWVEGRLASKPGLVLRPGDRVEIALPPETSSTPIPESIPIDVIHEDEHLLVVDKPAGLVVHPGHGRPSGTLVNALLGRGTRLASVGAPDRPGIVHRLDEGTSGLLVVAKDDATHHALSRALAERTVRKQYVALVWGRPGAAVRARDRTQPDQSDQDGGGEHAWARPARVDSLHHAGDDARFCRA